MKILFITPEFPYPFNNGTKIREYNLLKGLAKKNTITLLSLYEGNKIDQDSVNHLKKILFDVITFKYKISKRKRIVTSLLSLKPYRYKRFANSDLLSKAEELLKKERFDIVWVHYYSYIVYNLNERIIKDANVKVFYDIENIDEVVWKQYLKDKNIFFRIFALQNYIKVLLIKKKLVNKTDIITSISKNEIDYLKRIDPYKKIFLVPNGVDIPEKKNKCKKNGNKKKILFCGSMDLTMNIDAVVWFANCIFPKIKKEIKDVEFWIVGKDPEKSVLKLKEKKGIFVSGSVKEIKPYYEESDVFVAPFRYGSGSKLKILEAMVMGLQIVSTSIGVTGFEFVDNKQLSIVDNEEAFAKAVIKILKNNVEDEALNDKSLSLIDAKYNWQNIVSNLNNIILSSVRNN